MNVKWFLSDTYVCGHIRGEVPARALNAFWNDVRVDCKTDVLYSDYFKTDLMVFQRLTTNVMLEKMRAAKKLGIRVVYDLDDNVFEVPPEFKMPYDFFNQPDVMRTTLAFIREVDAVTVSTLPLGKVVSKLTPRPSFVVENAIDLDRWRDAQIDRAVSKPLNPEKLVIGWMASESHLVDIGIVADALHRILDKYPNVEIHTVGSLTAEHFAKYGFKDRLVFEPWAEINNLPFVLSSFDVAIAPLTDNTFNQCKSGIKWMQYSALGIPCVCSECPSFGGLVKSGLDGFLAKDDGWFEPLDQLLSSPELREKIGRKALQSVQAFDINKKAEDWYQAWRQIMKL